MELEVLAIGNEILDGSIIDTNTAYLAAEAELMGLSVSKHHVVGDKIDEVVKLFRSAGVHADVVFVTGGLGPTPDDLTSEAAAKASDKPIVLFPEALKAIEDFFKKLDRKMPKANQKQAYFPEHAVVLENPIGSAPGFSCRIGRALFFFMPGVPHEMKKMFQEQVKPYILKSFEARLEPSIVSSFTTFGISEAVIGSILREFSPNESEIKFGTQFQFPETQIKVYIKASDEEKIESMKTKANEFIDKYFKDWIVSSDGESISIVTDTLLKEKKKTLSIIEVDNGGAIPSCLSKVTTNLEYLSFYVLCQSHDTRKLDFMNSQSNHDSHVLASNIRKYANTDYGIAIKNTIESNKFGKSLSGHVSIGVASEDDVEEYQYIFPFGGDEYKKRISAITALEIIRRKILGIPMLTEILGKLRIVN